MPNTGRQDYDQLVKFSTLGEGEPYFMLRGQDAVAADTVRAWASLARAAGTPDAVVEQALQQADNLEAWKPKKVPDGDHLTAEAQKELAYEFSRRAYRAQTDCADPKIMLAEERAFQSVLGRLRPVLALLFARGEWKDGVFVYDPRAKNEHHAEYSGSCAIEALGHLQTVLRSEPAPVLIPG